MPTGTSVSSTPPPSTTASICASSSSARRRGSMGEIVRDGENGFLVDSLDDAAAAVGAAGALERAAVRASVEVRFDADRMVDDYLALYRRVVALRSVRRAELVGQR